MQGVGSFRQTFRVRLRADHFPADVAAPVAVFLPGAALIPLLEKVALGQGHVLLGGSAILLLQFGVFQDELGKGEHGGENDRVADMIIRPAIAPGLVVAHPSFVPVGASAHVLDTVLGELHGTVEPGGVFRALVALHEAAGIVVDAPAELLAGAVLGNGPIAVAHGLLEEGLRRAAFLRQGRGPARERGRQADHRRQGHTHRSQGRSHMPALLS